MSLREYILRRQGQTRDRLDTLRLQTLPILNAWIEDTLTIEDFFDADPGGMSEDDRQALKALRYDVEQATDRDIDFGPVDEQLSTDIE